MKRDREDTPSTAATTIAAIPEEALCGVELYPWEIDAKTFGSLPEGVEGPVMWWSTHLTGRDFPDGYQSDMGRSLKCWDKAIPCNFCGKGSCLVHSVAYCRKPWNADADGSSSSEEDDEKEGSKKSKTVEGEAPPKVPKEVLDVVPCNDIMRINGSCTGILLCSDTSHVGIKGPYTKSSTNEVLFVCHDCARDGDPNRGDLEALRCRGCYTLYQADEVASHRADGTCPENGDAEFIEETCYDCDREICSDPACSRKPCGGATTDMCGDEYGRLFCMRCYLHHICWRKCSVPGCIDWATCEGVESVETEIAQVERERPLCIEHAGVVQAARDELRRRRVAIPPK